MSQEIKAHPIVCQLDLTMIQKNKLPDAAVVSSRDDGAATLEAGMAKPEGATGSPVTCATKPGEAGMARAKGAAAIDDARPGLRSS